MTAVEHGKVRCRFHGGPMSENFAQDGFTCLGFDGEGCDQFVGASLLDQIDFLHEQQSRGFDKLLKGTDYEI